MVASATEGAFYFVLLLHNFIKVLSSPRKRRPKGVPKNALHFWGRGATSEKDSFLSIAKKNSPRGPHEILVFVGDGLAPVATSDRLSCPRNHKAPFMGAFFVGQVRIYLVRGRHPATEGAFYFVLLLHNFIKVLSSPRKRRPKGVPTKYLYSWGDVLAPVATWW